MRTRHRHVPTTPVALVALVVLALNASVAAAGAPIDVSGRVIDAEGRPIAEAIVTCHRPTTPLEEHDDLGDVPDGQVVARALTDSEGRYRLRLDGAGHFDVRVEAAGFVGVEMELRPLIESRSLGEARLDADVGYAVEIVDDDGAPIPDALVRLGPSSARRASGATWSRVSRLARTDAEGKAHLSRPPAARETLSVTAASHRSVRFGASTGLPRRLVVERALAHPVVVLDARGRPVADVVLTDRSVGHVLAVTDAEGRASVSTGELGERFVALAPDGRATATRRHERASGDPPQTIELPPSAIVRGRVVDASSGAGVEGAIVWAQEDPSLGATSVSGGTFGISVSGEAPRTLRAGAPGYLRSAPVRARPPRDGYPEPTIALEPAASIEGIVVDAEGRGVEGARVSLRERISGSEIRIEIGGGSTPREATQTREGGRFRLDGIDPGKSWDLEVRAPGFATATERIDALEPRRVHADVRVELSKGLALRGRVVDEEGRPIGAARVSARRAAPSEGGRPTILGRGTAPPEIETLTDDEGAFVLEGLAGGAVDVGVEREGYARRRLPGVALDADARVSDVGDVVLEPGRTLQGLVVDEDGRPIEGVELRVQRGDAIAMPGLPRDASEEPAAFTGPDGWFAISGLAEGERVSLSASREGFVRGHLQNVEIPADQPPRLELVAASALEGVVVDPEGAPLRDATVTLERTVRSAMGGMAFVMMTREGERTDADGAFRFDGLDEGEVAVEASATGYQKVRRTLQIERGEDLLGVELPLDAGSVLTGAVTLADGRPAIGAVVRPVEEGAERGPALAPARTDGDGVYVLEGLAPGVATIEAVREPGPQRAVKEIELDPGVNTLDLGFSGGHDVRGQVVDPDGAPVAGAWVRVAPAGSPWSGAETRSDADGRFELTGMLDGEYLARSGREGYADARERRVSVDGAPVDELVLALRRGARIEGRAVGLEDDDAARVIVTASPESGGDFRRVRSDHSGAFVIADAVPGTWELRGRVEGTGRQARATTTIEEGLDRAQVSLEFGSGLVLTGQVAQNDRPIAGASMYVEGLDVARRGWAETDSEGRFVADGLAPGRYRIDVRHWRTGLAHAEEIELDGDRDVRIDIPTTRVSGRVVAAADGEPISGARVTLEPLDGVASASMGLTQGSSSDLDGRFVLSPVPEGRYRIRATQSGYATSGFEIGVKGGASRDDLEIELEATEGVLLQIVTSSGQVPESVRISVLDPAGSTLLSGRHGTGEQGKVRLASVPPGTWEVIVAANGWATSSLRVTAPGGPVAVTLTPPCTLGVEVVALVDDPAVATMQILDGSGRPHRSARWFGGVEDRFDLVRGKASVETLAAGRYTVIVSAADGRVWREAVRVSPGTPATLRLE